MSESGVRAFVDERRFAVATRERWLAQAKFNHAKHTGVSCDKCHDAVHSQDTADILLPARETCTACHSPRGGVANACAECHTYHQPQLVTR